MGIARNHTIGEQLGAIGRVEIAYWIAGNKQPLRGKMAIDAIAAALVEMIDDDTRLDPTQRNPVLDRVDRIHARLHDTVERAFQEKWRRGDFQR